MKQPDKPDAVPRLGAVRRRALSAASGLVRFGGSLPLRIEPTAQGVDLASWATGAQAMIEKKLAEHGALLFRHFDIEGIQAFERFVRAVAGGALEYRFRASPRTEVGHHIYTATDYPADQSIFPHNEHAYSPVCPLRLFFYCQQPAAIGGETPIGSGRAITQAIDAGVCARFKRKQVLYVRNYGDGFGLPWQTVFQTPDKAQVERYCKEVGIAIEWKSGDRLCTRQVGPALVRHPRLGERIWFNHATFFHVTTLPSPVREALLSEFDQADLPQNTYYGDGSAIETETLEHLRAVYRAAMVSFPWQSGDILLVDNILTVHGRQPFSGARRVLVAMADTFCPRDLAVQADKLA